MDVLRIFTVGVLLSGILVIWNFGYQGSGRVIAVTTVLAAVFGISVMQYSKPLPASWAPVALTAFWLGVIGAVGVWAYALRNDL
jgi:hypothetical protein